MKVSAKSEYGVRAMVQLARAYGKGPMPLSEIAEKEHISPDFLEQLMVALRNKGLVKSVRGARGGYLLAVDPSEITLGDVMWSMDGPFVPVQCLDFVGETQDTCCMGILKPDCSTRDVWVLLRERVTETMNSVRLSDLCRETGQPLRLPTGQAGGLGRVGRGAPSCVALP